MLQLPVTAVTGNPIVTLVTDFESKEAYIADTIFPIKNSMISLGKTDFVPISLISMAFGATFALDESHATIELGESKITVWPDTNIALVGNTPVTLDGNVYGIGSDFMIPVELVAYLGVTSNYNEENEEFEFTYDSNPFKITTSEISSPYAISFNNPNIDNVAFDVQANRTIQAVISCDSDWLVAWPETLEIGATKKPISLKFATNKLMQAGEKRAYIKISTAFGSKDIPIIVSTPSSERIVKIQIGNKTGYIDGKETTLTQPPFIDGGTTLVPYRFLGEAFGATIEWIAESKTVRATLDRTTVELVIGQKTAKVNGVPTTLSKAPIIVKGSTFVPFRFIGEAFKAKVDWNQTNKIITVTLDMNQNNPKLSIKPQDATLNWNDADEAKVPSTATFDVKNDGFGTLQVLDAYTLGTNLKTNVSKDKITVSTRYNPTGVEENDYLVIKTNAGTDIKPIKVGIYPKNISILTANQDGSWYINGLKQNDAFKKTQGLISCSAMRVAGAASGSSLYDGISNELSITASNHKLWLNVQSGDFMLDGTKMPWKFTYNLSETDISLPIAVYSLAFGWQIKETADGKARMFIPRDKPSNLASVEKSIDLVWDTTPKRMSAFNASTYPLKNNGSYSFEKSESKYKLFFFFSNDSVSENIIPYIESIKRRFSDKDLETNLVSTTVKSDTVIEQFFAGNQTITNGLASLSIAGLTTPILFDSDGSICAEFGGEAVPRLYIVDIAGNLIFELPDMNESQIPYLEQAVSAIVSNSTSLPQDVQTITIINQGGNAGEGSLSPSNQDISVLKPKFKTSPTKVSISLSSAPLEKETTLPAFKKTSLTLLGNSNQSEIPVRYWKLPKFSIFTSFTDGSKKVRFGKAWRIMPSECLGGDDPVCPISEIIGQVGGQTRIDLDGRVTMTAGDKEIILTIGTQKAFIGSKSIELGKPFTLTNGIVYGPAKLLSEAIGSVINRFNETFCIISPSLKGSATGPILETNVQSLTFNNFIKPIGGYPIAPDFTLNNYPESTGKNTSLDSILARPEVKVLVIDFWATWCPPCKSGMPYMEKMYREYKDKGLALFGVIGDAKQVDDDYVASILEDDSRIRGGLKKLGLDAITYPMLYENRTGPEAFRLYKGESIPRVVVITKDKKWAFTKVGFWEIGHRNLEFTVRRLLGIEESSKLPSINVRNAGIDELKGKVTCDLPFIIPKQPEFSTMNKISLSFELKPNAAPTIPQRGNITISTNGGNQTIPIQYNALSEQMVIDFAIKVENGETVINGNKVNIVIPSKTINGKLLLSIDMVMSTIGGQTRILPDKKRAMSVFENWDILFINNSKDVSVGPITIKSNENVVIEDGHVYTDLDTLSYILAMEYDLKDENKTIVLRYEP
jgi:thiol-disulfide isomerase/thioredoxin